MTEADLALALKKPNNEQGALSMKQTNKQTSNLKLFVYDSIFIVVFSYFGLASLGTLGNTWQRSNFLNEPIVGYFYIIILIVLLLISLVVIFTSIKRILTRIIQLIKK